MNPNATKVLRAAKYGRGPFQNCSSRCWELAEGWDLWLFRGTEWHVTLKLDGPVSATASVSRAITRNQARVLLGLLEVVS